jgi:hypothetical protein
MELPGFWCKLKAGEIVPIAIRVIITQVIEGRIVDCPEEDSALVKRYLNGGDMAAFGKLAVRYMKPVTSIIVGMLNPPMKQIRIEGLNREVALTIAYACDVWEAVVGEMNASANARRAAIEAFHRLLFNVCLRQCRQWLKNPSTQKLEDVEFLYQAGKPISEDARDDAIIEALVQLGLDHPRCQEALVLKLFGVVTRRLTHAEIGEIMALRQPFSPKDVAEFVRGGTDWLKNSYPYLFTP